MVARANERASRMPTTGAEQAMALSAKEFCRRTQDRCVLRCLRWRHIDGRRAADLHADLPMTEGSGRALLIDRSAREAPSPLPSAERHSRPIFLLRRTRRTAKSGDAPLVPLSGV